MKANIIELQEALRFETLQRYKEVQDTLSTLRKEEKELKEKIISMMTNNRLEVNDLVAILKITESHSIDTDAVKKDFPELWKEYPKVTERKSIVIV